MSDTILLERHDDHAVITLNRPEKLNAWTADMRRRLTETLRSVGEEDSCRVVIITGAGRGFCAGQDLGESAGTDPSDHDAADRWIDSFEELYRAVRELDQITIAAINGVAAGSGFQLALLADFRVGDARARLGQPEARSGIPSVTGLWAMTNIMSLSKAAEFALSAELVDAQEAKSLGLVNFLAEPGEALSEARALGQRISALPQGAVRLTKQRIRDLTEASFVEAFEAAKRIHRRAYGSGEPQRKMSDFVRKS
ncbi:enoyl-CoA hydratase/isomerase family protein [Leucobacter sp. CSA1]|uniref:Enoyl-CoA hydratase/isomerase family protein n=1 Tax=Leucobacter chromiisoli TaxID=2796471 RepID=A0A934Q7W7_9MICO|nr:enoyl-CoA hydratase/isomerase family protein [Leucobacter chromiisoli]MBK0418299.1 enoyl-CoA hydratase/isomerase family protein [Leucobacter chromiisoli]